VGGSNTPQTNPRRQMAAILKIRKIAIYLQQTSDFDAILLSNVTGTFKCRQPIKFGEFKNRRLVAAIFENQ